MGWRFRKSVKILPGVRLNLNTKSTSISVGGRGFHKTFSSTGRVTNTVGIPGTGIYYTETSGTGRRRQNTYRQTVSRNYTSNIPVTETVPAAPIVDINEVKANIKEIYQKADSTVDWEGIMAGAPATPYFKEHANKILDGDIDTYYQVVSDVNPLDDLIQYGSDFECGTDDPRNIYIHFHVNITKILKDAKKLPKEVFNDLWQDYVCGCSIRIARDMFALLPVRHVIVDAWDNNKDILSVDFKRREFDKLDFQNLDASDTVETFRHNMDFNLSSGFKPISPLE